MKGQQTDGIKNVIQEAQLKIAQIIFPQTQPPSKFELSNYPISDLACFGNYDEPDTVAFRWPTQDDLKALNLQQPLKLREIRYSGYQTVCDGDFLASLQLIFEDGIESPVMGNKNNQAAQMKIFKVEDQEIASL